MSTSNLDFLQPQVTSNIIFATDAFEHVASRFDNLRTVFGEADILPQDFAIEVGFVPELLGNIEGVYLYCRKPLKDELAELLVDIFHPFPYILLPLSEVSGGDDKVVDESCSDSPCDVRNSAQEKGKQRVVPSGVAGGGWRYNRGEAEAPRMKCLEFN